MHFISETASLSRCIMKKQPYILGKTNKQIKKY